MNVGKSMRLFLVDGTVGGPCAPKDAEKATMGAPKNVEYG
jgi:hypothetical protein